MSVSRVSLISRYAQLRILLKIAVAHADSVHDRTPALRSHTCSRLCRSSAFVALLALDYYIMPTGPVYAACYVALRSLVAGVLHVH
jgi:hypothetical protein